MKKLINHIELDRSVSNKIFFKAVRVETEQCCRMEICFLPLDFLNIHVMSSNTLYIHIQGYQKNHVQICKGGFKVKYVMCCLRTFLLVSCCISVPCTKGRWKRGGGGWYL
jgi:hypothetical protein